MYNESIKAKLSTYILAGKKSFIIYPYGEIGKNIKQILFSEFAIEEKLILDDLIYDKTDSIYPIEYLKNNYSSYQDSYIIIATTIPELYAQKEDMLLEFVDEDHILTIFEKAKNFEYNFQMFKKRGFDFEREIYTLSQDGTSFYLPFWETDYIQKTIVYEDSYYEESYLFYLMNRFKDRIRDKCVLDIGANIGNHSI